ncbi:FAD-dependent oxidoreductase [Curvibacter sp. CHRR-16]|uniref:FAD-dependent oxidoreductase n=1 Tax=Curvibacter sp. CHRR-16 TaxID=2835872 RepID=UPI001BD93693|nr:FAD-dependent oxidoreductase [Curvibacter sp. CHRR-16]MBT0568877.1 FAD-dependent oxidoreductase [Curvibacter sp. CHRR-16]
MNAPSIGIAGAGLLGRLLAWQLLERGHRVAVFDPASSLVEAPPAYHPTRAAGWTAAGMLSPTAELECANAQVFALGLRSLTLWRDTVARLNPISPVSLSHAGSLLLAHRGDEGAAQRVLGLLASKLSIEQLATQAAQHAPQPLTPIGLHALEPDIHGPAHAWLLPHEGHIHTVQAMAALGQAITQHPLATLHLGAAGGVQTTGPGWLRTAAGEQRMAHVLDVRGTGYRTGYHTRIRGVRGEIFWLHAPGLPLSRPLRLLHPRWRVYIVPRGGDMVVVGATEIESEDRSPVSVRSTLELLSAAHSVLPALAEARIVHSEANLRPATPDNLPCVHHSAGLSVINGLFRHGWLIAPALVEQALHTLGL